MRHVPTPEILNDRWTDALRQEQLDLPPAERTVRGASWMYDPFEQRLATATLDAALLGRNAALHWIDVTGRALDGWDALDRVQLVVDHAGRLNLDSYTPGRRGDPDHDNAIPVRYPEVRMWEGASENTINDDYIDGFDAWAPVWSPLLEREFCVAMVRIARECPNGVGRDDLDRARRAVLGDVAVRLEGERLREAIATLPAGDPPDTGEVSPSTRRRM